MMYVHYSQPIRGDGINSCHTHNTTHKTDSPLPSHIPLPPSTHIRNDDDDNGGVGDAEGGDRSNGTVVG